MEIICRPLQQGEYASAAKLEQECLNTAWSEDQIANIPENAYYIGAFDGNELCGIGSAYFVLDECQVMNIAVSPQYRKKGVGTRIMNEIINKSLEKNCEFISLEVAEDNISAIALYEKSDFVAIGKRKNFYGTTSALIMEKNL